MFVRARVIYLSRSRRYRTTFLLILVVIVFDIRQRMLLQSLPGRAASPRCRAPTIPTALIELFDDLLLP